MLFLFGWVALALAVTGSVLSARKIKWCWVIWMVANICSIIYCFTVTPVAIPIIIQEAIFFGINIYGMWNWFKKKE